MGDGGAIERIKRARKAHLCDWCAETIEPGSSYCRWRNFGYDDPPVMVRMHPECFEASKNDPSKYAARCGPNDYDDEFYVGAHPRGGNCGWCGECEHCRDARRRRHELV